MKLKSIAGSTVRNTVSSAIMAAALLSASPLVLAQEASIHQVYEAAESGKFIEAQAMMDKVLADHPNSGRAHFVEAELLAKQGKRSQAAAELATAERLSPGLKFAKPEAVQHLRAALGNRAGAVSPSTMGLSNPRPAAQEVTPAQAPMPFQAPASRGLPWGTLLVLGALIVLAFMFFRRKRPTQPGMGAPGSYGANFQGYPQGGQPGYPNAGQPGYPQQPGYPPQPGYGAPAAGMGGGLGSGIVGGLATGAALGAGMVAGQALAHRFTDGNRDDSGNHLGSGGGFGNTPSQPQVDAPPADYDMGGSDFGLNDSSSWDSGGDSGGGDSGGSDWD
jgi:hypothetical protein